MSKIWPSRQKELARLSNELKEFSAQQHVLLGIGESAARKTLAMQMVASVRRLDFTRINKNRGIDAKRADPNNLMFDPERAATLYAKAGNLDEATWIIFLATHIGKHGKYGWQRMRDVYSGLGKNTWTWRRLSSDPSAFETWMQEHYEHIGGAFGNHRKYESLKPDSDKGTVAVVESFFKSMNGSPAKWFSDLVRRVGNDPHKIFDAAYNEVQVLRFGRLAKFDFLALLGRLDLVPMSPGSTYLSGATGPLRGARLLVDGDPNSKTSAESLEGILELLDSKINIGMQAMEDSICNWQKSPKLFVHFKG